MNKPSLDPIHDLLFGASKALVLKFAIELEVFTAISQGKQNAKAIAEYKSCSVNGIRALLDALIPLGYLVKDDELYALTPTSSSFLVKDKPSYYGDSYLDALLPWAFAESSDPISAALRSEHGAGKEITNAKAVALWKPWCEAHATNWESIVDDAKEMWAMVRKRAQLPAGPKVLDLACGHGLWTLTLCLEDSQTRLIAVDRYPEVLETVHSLAKKMDITDQVSCQTGNIHDVEFEHSSYDIVYIGGVLYLFSEAEIIDILTRVAQGIRSDGLLVVNTMIVDADRRDALGPLIQSFRRFLYNGGRVPTLNEYQNLFEKAGFNTPERISENVLVAQGLRS